MVDRAHPVDCRGIRSPRPNECWQRAHTIFLLMYSVPLSYSRPRSRIMAINTFAFIGARSSCREPVFYRVTREGFPTFRSACTIHDGDSYGSSRRDSRSGARRGDAFGRQSTDFISEGSKQTDNDFVSKRLDVRARY